MSLDMKLVGKIPALVSLETLMKQDEKLRNEHDDALGAYGKRTKFPERFTALAFGNHWTVINNFLL